MLCIILLVITYFDPRVDSISFFALLIYSCNEFLNSLTTYRSSPNDQFSRLMFSPSSLMVPINAINDSGSIPASIISFLKKVCFSSSVAYIFLMDNKC